MQNHGDSAMSSDAFYPNSSHSQVQSQDNLKLSAFVSLLSSTQSLGIQEFSLASPEPLLANLLSPNTEFGDSNPKNFEKCSIPSLLVVNKATANLCNEKGMSQRDAAALSLAFPLFFDRSDVKNAPMILINNISESLAALVTSRMRSSKNALLREMYNRGDVVEARALHEVFEGGASKLSVYSLLTIVTSFRVLSMTGEASDDQIRLPVLFESTSDYSVLGTTVPLSLQAPGTITASVNHDGLLDKVKIMIDPIELLDDMMKKVKELVKNILTSAAVMTYSMSSSSQPTCGTFDSFEKTNGSKRAKQEILSWTATDKGSMQGSSDEQGQYASNSNHHPQSVLNGLYQEFDLSMRNK
mmetsp:Transcript_27665/g.33645  ORF Transcript_27665/g.33645 Transcript_27665/m.33645 type:complete len:356 (+) Transcript_27665:80-1147(+)|eukprot:CAMPEP_0172510192 /NCGR_PEP_ID=MMETSP1066-20121228/226961_1 /TAXON_ID=671091 /ORGANISM="Coscinodiscus wailesii, Strain CCMP2513" /LENGTH=355 /DNA_ID=CAMNT_0013289059 /DNA_START=76 /DNA_END=1143 /DNA_ORIENTATION=-